MASFDVETTGKDPATARIVTASVVTTTRPTSGVQSWLADPGVEIPDEAAAIHGVTTEHARQHGSPARLVALEVAHALIDAWSLGRPVVIYNAPYDLTVVDRELRRYGYDGLAIGGLVIDSLVLDKAMDRYRKGSRRLVDVAKHYGITLTEEDAHTSTGDCLAAARVAWKLATIFYDEIGSMEPDELMAYQASAYRRQALSFQEHLRRQGKPADDVSTEWPIRLFAAAEVVA
jgi:DNA polymerase-3 subunit epsilon